MRPRYALRLAFTAITVAVICACSAGTAVGAVGFETEVEPSSFAVPGLTTLTYRLKMTTGLSDERFSVTMHQPLFPEGGSPIGMNHVHEDVSFTGPGRVGQALIVQPALACARNGAYGPTFPTFDVYLPPLSTTVLSARFQAGRAAPFLGSDYRVRFIASPAMVSREPSTLDHEESFFTPAPRRTGKTGVRIKLHGRYRPRSGQSSGRLRRGQRVVFYGTTDPVLRNRRVVIQYRFYSRRTQTGRTRNLPAVKTDASGRFRATWRPRAVGTYQFSALSAETPQFVADRGPNCPLTYAVRPR